jgi:hypothetical protein
LIGKYAVLEAILGTGPTGGVVKAEPAPENITGGVAMKTAISILLT